MPAVKAVARVFRAIAKLLIGEVAKGIVVEATEGVAGEVAREVAGEATMHKVTAILMAMSPEVGCLVGILAMATMGGSS